MNSAEVYYGPKKCGKTTLLMERAMEETEEGHVLFVFSTHDEAYYAMQKFADHYQDLVSSVRSANKEVRLKDTPGFIRFVSRNDTWWGRPVLWNTVIHDRTDPYIFGEEVGFVARKYIYAFDEDNLPSMVTKIILGTPTVDYTISKLGA